MKSKIISTKTEKEFIKQLVNTQLTSIQTQIDQAHNAPV